MKKKILWITFLIFTGFLASGIAYCFTKNRILYSMAVTFGTAFYHFAMRLAVACVIDTKFHNLIDTEKKWFQERSFEPKIYQLIRVRKWKKWFPALNPEDFLLERKSPKDIIQAACQAEIIHEVIVVFSFIPVIFSVWFGDVEIFFVTSCLSALFDGIFVIIQRYNRPRLMRLAGEKQKKGSGKSCI